MKKRRMLIGTLLLISLLSLALASCGGSGGGDSSLPGDTGSSHWNELKWDEDKWG